MTSARLLSIAAFLLLGCGRADIDTVPDGSTSGSEASAGEAAGDPDTSEPPPAATSCDPKQLRCRRAAPVCPEGEVPSVSGTCYGACVPLEQCACSQADDCPNPDSYTCHLYARHCGPYVH